MEGDQQLGNVGAIEKIRFTIYKKEEFGKIIFYKLYLESEVDLYFDYFLIIDEYNFKQILEENEIQMNLEQFGHALKTMIENIKSKPQLYFIVLTMKDDKKAILEIHQNLEYKYILLLRLRFLSSDDQKIREYISFKYGVLSARMDFLVDRLQDVTSIIKLKNPNLLLQIQKALALN